MYFQVGKAIVYFLPAEPPSMTSPSPARFNSNTVYQPPGTPSCSCRPPWPSPSRRTWAQEMAAAAGLYAEVVASGRYFFEQLHVLRLKVESRA